MNDQGDRQAPFWRLYKSAVMGCLLPEAHAGVSAGVMRAVWRVYADHADNTTHISFPARDRVAAICGFSTKQVSRAVAALVETGWLEVIQPARQHSSDVCRVIIQTGHHVLSEVYPDIQTGHGVYSEVLPGVSSEVYPDIQTGHHVRQGGHHVPQTGHHVPLTNITNKELVEVDSSVSPQASEDTTDHQRLFKEGETEESEAVHTRHHQEHTEQPSAIDRIRMLLEDDEQTHRGVWLVAQRIGRKLSEQDARSIAFTLQANTFSAEEMMQYLGEKIADHSETPDRLMVRYINADAPSWLLEARERSRVYIAPSYDVKRYTDEERALIEQEEREAEEARQRQVDELMASERGQRYLEEGRRMLEGGMNVNDVLSSITGGRR